MTFFPQLHPYSNAKDYLIIANCNYTRNRAFIWKRLNKQLILYLVNFDKPSFDRKCGYTNSVGTMEMWIHLKFVHNMLQNIKSCLQSVVKIISMSTLIWKSMYMTSLLPCRKIWTHQSFLLKWRNLKHFKSFNFEMWTHHISWPIQTSDSHSQKCVQDPMVVEEWICPGREKKSFTLGTLYEWIHFFGFRAYKKFEISENYFLFSALRTAASSSKHRFSKAGAMDLRKVCLYSNLE